MHFVASETGAKYMNDDYMKMEGRERGRKEGKNGGRGGRVLAQQGSLLRLWPNHFNSLSLHVFPFYLILFSVIEALLRNDIISYLECTR